MSSSKVKLIHRRLYRALLRAARPFTPPSPDAAALSCLLHRSFIPLEVDESLAQQEEAKDSLPRVQRECENEFIDRRDGFTPKRSDAHFLLFRRLLQHVFADDEQHDNDTQKKGVRCLQWPSQVKEKPFQLRDIIRREFRVPEENSSEDKRFSAGFTIQARRDCAFLALRKLNEKIVWADQLEDGMPKPCPQQAAKHVSPIPLTSPSSSYLKPGTFLVAHPHLSGYFRRSVIVILQHGNPYSTATRTEKADGEEGDEDFGTYGVVINRPSVQETSGKIRTLADVVSILPKELAGAFGGLPVRDGGPVHMPSIQMLHACSLPDGGPNKHPFLKEIGGTRMLSFADSNEKTVYFQGDIIKAAEAVKTDHLDRDDVAFFVGASSWYSGQLEQEIAQGCWLPVSGSPEIALSGVCEHEPVEEAESRPKADLWLSMLSSCGEDEYKLAHLVTDASENDEFGAACDEF